MQIFWGKLDMYKHITCVLEFQNAGFKGPGGYHVEISKRLRQREIKGPKRCLLVPGEALIVAQSVNDFAPLN